MVAKEKNRKTLSTGKELNEKKYLWIAKVPDKDLWPIYHKMKDEGKTIDEITKALFSVEVV